MLQIRNESFVLASLGYRLMRLPFLYRMKVRAFTENRGSEYCLKLLALARQRSCD